jgi:nitric oxide reductase NorD protein
MDATALRQRLDYLLGPVLSARRSAAPLAEAIAALDTAQQAFVLHWIEVIDRSNYELAYRFAAAAPAALRRFDEAAARAWLLDALDHYDREGLHSASRVLQDPAAFATADPPAAARFAEHAGVLRLFVCGLAGRPLPVEAGTEASTDTDTLYLPACIASQPSSLENFNIYKGLGTLLWAQNRYGSHRRDLAAACAEYPDPAHAAELLMHLEMLRLTPRIATVLPGIARLLAGWHGAADPRCAILREPGATVDDSLGLLGELYGRCEPPRLPWRIGLHAQAAARREARVQRERGELAEQLARWLAGRQGQGDDGDGDGDGAGRFSIDGDGSAGYTLRLDGEPLEPPRAVAERLESLLQDLGEIPDDCLQAPAGAESGTAAAETASADNAGAPFHYDEWDCRRRHYRRHWCTLREVEPKSGDSAFVAATLARYRPQIDRLKRSFEALRGEDRRLHRQHHGDDLDIDAVIEARIALRNGEEMPQRLFSRRHKAERDLAALFMVDMSGSTKGWINEAEREALVMLCEALEVLGDRYAIYGFSGVTRQRCEVYPVKRFEEPYGDAVRGRIAGIAPRDYTRMGAAIRHLSAKLSAVDARTRLLVTLSDGKPDDYSDHYRGEYGIEDTRQALLEAHRAGIRPFCITIDHEARDYLPHLYGPVSWTLVDQVDKLPLKVAEIYRRLTS